MRFSILLALILSVASIGSAMAEVTAPVAKSNDTKYVSKVRIGGWIGNDALLVLPDRTAGAAPIPQGFGGVKLLEIGDTSYTVEYAGTKGKITLDPAWQLAPHPDLTNWLISYMKNVGTRIDAQYTDVSNDGGIHIAHNGAATSTFMKVQQASPFESLPDWMESIDLKVSINPHQPTKVQFIAMTITPDAYARLIK